MSKYIIYKSTDKLPTQLKIKHKLVWGKGIVYGIKKVFNLNQNKDEVE